MIYIGTAEDIIILILFAVLLSAILRPCVLRNIRANMNLGNIIIIGHKVDNKEQMICGKMQIRLVSYM